MKVWHKKSVRWTLNGKRVRPRTTGANRVVIPSKRYYGTLRTFEGETKQVPLCEDRQSSRTLLRRLQTEQDRLLAVGVSRQDAERERLLEDLLTEYESHLHGKGDAPRYISETLSRIRAIFGATGAKTLADVDADHISATLTEWRTRPVKPISIATSNTYARAVKCFTRWLWRGRRIPNDPLLPLPLLNARVDCRHVRRAMTHVEFNSLVRATETSRKTLCGLTPTDRAILYTLASYTGLRASELASLTPSSFDLEAGTLMVEACYSKRRRLDTLPLHASLVERLRPWLARKADGILWRKRWGFRRCKSARMLRSDLKRAGIPYVDERGRVVDFHALRHTFISSLARSGVHPLKAKELARHSTITLTMDVYCFASDETGKSRPVD